VLPNDEGTFVIAYDLHASPPTISPANIPSGYAITTCKINDDGLAFVTMNQSS